MVIIAKLTSMNVVILAYVITEYVLTLLAHTIVTVPQASMTIIVNRTSTNVATTRSVLSMECV